MAYPCLSAPLQKISRKQGSPGRGTRMGSKRRFCPPSARRCVCPSYDSTRTPGCPGSYTLVVKSLKNVITSSLGMGEWKVILVGFLYFSFLFYLSIYFWLHWVLVVWWGLLTTMILFLGRMGSKQTGSVVVVPRLSFSTACEICLDQGSSPCPPHWQVDSHPPHHH